MRTPAEYAFIRCIFAAGAAFFCCCEVGAGGREAEPATEARDGEERRIERSDDETATGSAAERSG
jgi:hypothetical protein